MEDVATLGGSLRLTSGPTSGWGLALSELEWAVGLVWVGWDSAGATAAGLEVLVVSVVLTLAGLLCAVLKLSATELAAVEDHRFATMGVVSAAAGLFGGEEQEKQGK